MIIKSIGTGLNSEFGVKKGIKESSKAVEEISNKDLIIEAPEKPDPLRSL
jgi:hypothetical protein